jgi:ABC-type lipoprotein release transport system permease subunit
MLLGLAWRNLWRQTRRTALSLFSIAFASALMVFLLSFQLGVYGQMKESALKLFDGYAQIQPKGFRDDPDIRKTIPSVAALKREALDIPGVTAAAPRVNGFAILSNGSRSIGALVIGVDPTDESRVSNLAGRVVEGRYLTGADSGAAVIGDGLARNLGVGLGARLTLLGSAADGSVAADILTVTGIFHTAIPEIDRSMLEMSLSRAQATFGLEGQAHTIALGGASLPDIVNAEPRLNALGARHGLALQDWGALEPELRDSITLKYVTSSLFYITLVIVVTFIILNTLLMSVLERTREFGVLLALGMRPSLIGGMVWLELLILALTGAAIGIAIGGSVAIWFEIHGISIPGLKNVLEQYGIPTRLYPAVSPFTMLAGPLTVTTAIALGGIVPYLHVRRLQAARAMRAA